MSVVSSYPQRHPTARFSECANAGGGPAAAVRSSGMDDNATHVAVADLVNCLVALTGASEKIDPIPKAHGGQLNAAKSRLEIAVAIACLKIDA